MFTRKTDKTTIFSDKIFLFDYNKHLKRNYKKFFIVFGIFKNREIKISKFSFTFYLKNYLVNIL